MKKKVDDYNKTNNIDEIPLTDVDYEGVIYEPTNTIKKNIKLNKDNKKSIKSPKGKIKKAQNFNFNYFIAVTISLGIIIFGIIFFLTYASISNYLQIPKSTNPAQNIENQTIDNILNQNTNKNLMGIIKDINFEDGIIHILDVNKNKNYALKTISTSTFQDEYENIISITELKKGDLINFTFDSTNKIKYIIKSNLGFSLENVENAKIDIKNNILVSNYNSYNLSENLLVFKGETSYGLNEISDLDTLDIKGYNNTIFYINVKKSHGKLKFKNKPTNQDAVLEINRNIYKRLAEVNEISLKEGTHKVVIKSDNFTPFIKEISIKADEETILDLSEIQIKKGTLIIKSNISDYTLYINNNKENTNSPLQLNYGVYNVKIEKEDYLPFETQIYVNKEQIYLNVVMEKKEKLGKVTISSSPPEAQVFINNSFVGYTPLTYNLPYGFHSITLKKEKYKNSTISNVNINENENSFSIALNPVEETTVQTETKPEE